MSSQITKSELERKSSSDRSYVNGVVILVVLRINHDKDAWSNANVISDNTMDKI